MKKGLFFVFLKRFPVSVSENQLAIYLKQLLDLETSKKLIKEADIKELEPAKKLISKNFEIEENSDILRPLQILVFCLAVSL